MYAMQVLSTTLWAQCGEDLVPGARSQQEAAQARTRPAAASLILGHQVPGTMGTRNGNEERGSMIFKILE